MFVAGSADITALCTALTPYAEQTRRWAGWTGSPYKCCTRRTPATGQSATGARRRYPAPGIQRQSLRALPSAFIDPSYPVAVSGGGSLLPLHAGLALEVEEMCPPWPPCTDKVKAYRMTHVLPPPIIRPFSSGGCCCRCTRAWRWRRRRRCLTWLPRACARWVGYA